MFTVAHDQVVSEVERLLKTMVKEFFVPTVKTAREVQDRTVHPGVICDGCKEFVRGIRYKCSVCGDFDLCETCEAVDVHPEHALLKIRRPSQAPYRLLCQYPG